MYMYMNMYTNNTFYRFDRFVAVSGITGLKWWETGVHNFTVPGHMKNPGSSRELVNGSEPKDR
jgi:hypothetical protein